MRTNTLKRNNLTTRKYHHTFPLPSISVSISLLPFISTRTPILFSPCPSIIFTNNPPHLHSPDHHTLHPLKPNTPTTSTPHPSHLAITPFSRPRRQDTQDSLA